MTVKIIVSQRFYLLYLLFLSCFVKDSLSGFNLIFCYLL